MILTAIVVSALYATWRDARAGALGIRTLLAPLLLALILYALDEAAPDVAKALAGAVLAVVAIVAVPELAEASKAANRPRARVIPFPNVVQMTGR